MYKLRKLGGDIADLTLKGISIEGKVWEKSTIVTASVNSAQVLNPCNSRVALSTEKVCMLLLVCINSGFAPLFHGRSS